MKKPTPNQKNFSAKEISSYLYKTYKKKCPDFWKWFFEETKVGTDQNYNVLDADKAPEFINKNYIDYIQLLIEEFGAHNDGFIRIENDF